MWLDIQQNTEEWEALRLGKATSSQFAVIMANEGKAFGEPAKKYAQKIALEIVTFQKDETESFSNQWMERGHELEEEAVRLYEQRQLIKTTNGGFNVSGCGRFGDSPDANFGQGNQEVKTVGANAQWDRIKKGGIDPKYKWQITGHIWLGQKDWCDFIQYCPSFPEEHQLYVFRVERDEDMIERLKARLEDFWKLVEENVLLINNK